MHIIQAIIIGIVEGFTEFLPISSTGHMIITEHLLGLSEVGIDGAFLSLFTVVIQLGAILSVVVLYFKHFFSHITNPQEKENKILFYKQILIAVVPALILGFIFGNVVDRMLMSPLVVALALLGGGIVLLFVDKLFISSSIADEKYITHRKALSIGFWQTLALIPGMSRSAATIVGGMQQGLNRKLATEFSFYLAVPTMAAATGYKLLKAFIHNSELLTNAHNLGILFVGTFVSFIVGMLAIKYFITYVQKNGFKMFGWYRIALGIVLLFCIYKGVL